MHLLDKASSYLIAWMELQVIFSFKVLQSPVLFAQLAAKICFEDNNITLLYKDFNKMYASKGISFIVSHYS